MTRRFWIMGIITLLAGCAGGPLRLFDPVDWALVPHTIERGLASWYGPAFHGRSTASGERYNQWDYTAAHRTLPFGTVVRVKNLQNNQSVLVEITDRGPFIKNRLMDLSRRAAEEIGLIGPGVALVEIQIVQRRR